MSGVTKLTASGSVSSQVITIEEEPVNVQQAPQQRVYSTTLTYTLSNQIDGLLKNVLGLGVFSELVFASVMRYSLLYARKEELSEADGQFVQSRLCKTLAFLCNDCIIPAMKQGDERADALLDIHEEIEGILRELLPQGVDAEQFIQHMHQCDLNRIALEKRLVELECFYQEALQLIEAYKDISNHEPLVEIFNTMKIKLIELKDRREEMTLSVNQRIAVLEGRVEQVLLRFPVLTQQIDKIAADLEKGEAKKLELAHQTMQLTEQLNRV